ncbi:MAG: hypothetical protein VX589_16620 [Myxococcota bacterium]|nr:hypothetical protein [Myxococcota bacterium]
MNYNFRGLMNGILISGTCLLLCACGSGSAGETPSDTPLLAGPNDIQPNNTSPQTPGMTAPAAQNTTEPSTAPTPAPAPAPSATDSASQGQPDQETSEASPAQSDMEMPPVDTPTDDAEENNAPEPAEDIPVEEMQDDEDPASETNDGTMTEDEGANAMEALGQMQNVPPRPDYPMGPNDLVARRACLLFDEPADPIDIVELERDAGQVVLAPQPQTGYRIQIPASGTGYLALEVPDWAITIATFASFQQKVTILDPDRATEVRVPLSWNGACPEKGVTDHRLHYHAWGAFTVKIEGEPNTAMTLSFIKQN